MGKEIYEAIQTVSLIISRLSINLERGDEWLYIRISNNASDLHI